MSWLLYEGGEFRGEENMAIDEALARSLADGTGEPSLRFYRWKPWAISLGHHQSIADIDIERCAADGIDVVRRPTGGRAILHAEELTYCVVMPAGRRSILDAYNEISLGLVEGLRLYGIETTLQKSQPKFSEEYRDPTSVSCFSSSARYEIELDGRKLVGSAQRRVSGALQEVVLQHGSILCGPAHLRLAHYLRMADPRLVKRASDALRMHTTDLSAAGGGGVDIGRLSSSLRAGFEKAWAIRFEVAPVAALPSLPSASA
jgi:lipoyl(octanoyl) transferase